MSNDYSGHRFYCCDCDRAFGSNAALTQHLLSSIHASQFHCCDCDRDFVSSQALNQHLADKIHEPKKAVRMAADSNSYCEKCDREFSDDTALNQHLASVIHYPLGDIVCIAKKCKKHFTSPSALIHHLESGACRSKITRKSLNKLVRSNDVDKLICSGEDKLDTLSLHWDNGASASSSGVASVLTPSTDRSTHSSPSALSRWLTPTSSNFDHPPSILSLTASRSCSQCLKKFRTPQALQAHISSPVHESKDFHCPLSITAPFLDGSEAQEARKAFSTLSGLAQHLESGACEGGKGVWRLAMKYIEDQMRQNGCREWRLLK